MEKKHIDYIPDGNYIGYIWESDKSSPEVLSEPTSKSVDLKKIKNPFIIEANLYDADRNVSYSIRFADGRYYGVEYSDLTNGEYKEKRFCPNRMPGVRTLKFRYFWKEEEGDKQLELNYLTPDCLVFVGLEK